MKKAEGFVPSTFRNVETVLFVSQEAKGAYFMSVRDVLDIS